MVIKVANPGECPLRIAVHEKPHICTLKNMRLLGQTVCCVTPMMFPDDCPLHSGTIVIEKQRSESRDQKSEVRSQITMNKGRSLKND